MRKMYSEDELKTLVSDQVSGTNDGTNWTKLKINGVEKNIPAGGSGGTQLYKHSFTIADTSSAAHAIAVYTPTSTPFTKLQNLLTDGYITISLDGVAKVTSISINSLVSPLALVMSYVGISITSSAVSASVGTISFSNVTQSITDTVTAL